MIFIQVFLQPFDTFLNDTAFKSFKLSGYGITVFLSVTLIHIPELYIYRKQGQKWTLLNEVVVMTLGFACMGPLGYLYHSVIFGEMSISFSSSIGWTIYYALPFAPLYIPFWAYLRYRFSQVTVGHEELSNETLIIEGQSSGEKVQFKWSDFILATIDSNYLDIFVLND
ncbi:MAG TPA: hypothetical protein VJ917_11520 [Saprospiraceae bacterium]|nr:hypothetical protein [Saprospiraceae bacterium]